MGRPFAHLCEHSAYKLSSSSRGRSFSALNLRISVPITSSRVKLSICQTGVCPGKGDAVQAGRQCCPAAQAFVLVFLSYCKVTLFSVTIMLYPIVGFVNTPRKICSRLCAIADFQFGHRASGGTAKKSLSSKSYHFHRYVHQTKGDCTNPDRPHELPPLKAIPLPDPGKPSAREPPCLDTGFVRGGASWLFTTCNQWSLRCL